MAGVTRVCSSIVHTAVNREQVRGRREGTHDLGSPGVRYERIVVIEHDQERWTTPGVDPAGKVEKRAFDRDGGGDPRIATARVVRHSVHVGATQGKAENRYMADIDETLHEATRLAAQIGRASWRERV